MARYIDADKVHEFVDTKVTEGKDGWSKGVPYEWAYALTVIDNAPTADVAPRAEVAEELINMALSKIQIMISAIKAQEGNGIITEFNGGAKTALEIVFKDLAELKKKYTDATGTNVGHKTEGD